MVRILYAEDNDLIRISAKLAFRTRGHEVIVVEDGDSAIGALRGQTFDVLLTDNNMPGASGLEVIAEAKKLKHVPRLIILYTADNISTALKGVLVLSKAKDDIADICRIIHRELGLVIHPLDAL